MQCQEREYSRPGGRWMDCRRQPHRGETSGRERAKREHRSDAVLRSTNFSENALALLAVIFFFIPSIASIPVNFFFLFDGCCCPF